MSVRGKVAESLNKRLFVYLFCWAEDVGEIVMYAAICCGMNIIQSLSHSVLMEAMLQRIGMLKQMRDLQEKPLGRNYSLLVILSANDFPSQVIYAAELQDSLKLHLSPHFSHSDYFSFLTQKLWGDHIYFKTISQKRRPCPHYCPLQLFEFNQAKPMQGHPFSGEPQTPIVPPASSAPGLAGDLKRWVQRIGSFLLQLIYIYVSLC